MKPIVELADELRLLNTIYLKNRMYEVLRFQTLVHRFIEFCDTDNIEFIEKKVTRLNAKLRSIKTDCIEIRSKLTKLDLSNEEKVVYMLVDSILLEFFHSKERDLMTKTSIVKKAHELKEKHTVLETYDLIHQWLFKELGYDNKQPQNLFGFEMKDPDSFNRFINKNIKLLFINRKS